MKARLEYQTLLTLTPFLVIQMFNIRIFHDAIPSSLSCSILAQRCCSIFCQCINKGVLWSATRQCVVRGIPCHSEICRSTFVFETVTYHSEDVWL